MLANEIFAELTAKESVAPEKVVFLSLHADSLHRSMRGATVYVPGERYHTFLFAIDDDVVVDASVNGNEARFLNHSCAPNCDVVVDDKRLWIEAIHDIEVGEELVYDYAFILPERHTPAAKKRYPCHCGAITCRGTMLARKR